MGQSLANTTKMKSFQAVVLLTLAVSASAWFCKSNSDCGANQCCTRIGLTGWIKKCIDLSQEGEPCSSKGGFRGICPCADGLVCEKYPKRRPRNKGEGVCKLEESGSGYLPYIVYN